MKIKTCPFLIDGPVYQRYMSKSNSAHAHLGMRKLHTMQDWESPSVHSATNYISLPRVTFQAELRYESMGGGRILMKDEYGRQWSIFGAAADEVLPKMQMGKLTAWWVMTKKGQACGLTVDLSKPLMVRVPPNEDVPLMLEKAKDLNTVIPYFERMVI